MTILLGFLQYALLAIGWEVKRAGPLDLVATDLHGASYRITIGHP